jgi:hypothetical protein
MATRVLVLFPFLMAALTEPHPIAEPLPSVPSIIASVPFESHRRTCTLELTPGQGIQVMEVSGSYCGNGEHSPELDGDFALILKLGPTELSRAVLREGRFVKDKDEWRARSGDSEAALQVFQRPKKEPLICIRQYAGCNTNDYHFYWIDSQYGGPALRPVKIVGDRRQATSLGNSHERAANQLYASFEPGAVRLLGNVDRAKDILELAGYDDAGGFRYVDQFIEAAPGTWRFIRETRH